MTCLVIGPGLVGAYLGAAAGATTCITGRSGRPAATSIAFPVGLRSWRPRCLPNSHVDVSLPVLVATRIPDTPWATLPADALAAQNGLGQPRPVVVCFFALDIAADGVLAPVGAAPRVVVGRHGPTWTPVFTAWRSAGIAVEEVDDVLPAQWEKTVLNATVGPLCLTNGACMGVVWADPGLRRLALAATAECERVAHASGIAVPAGLVDRAQGFFERVGAHRPSVLKHPGELPWIIGELMRCALAAGVAVPALARIAEQVSAALERRRTTISVTN